MAKDKSESRSEAGKRRWDNMSAAEKKKVLKRLADARAARAAGAPKKGAPKKDDKKKTTRRTPAAAAAAATAAPTRTNPGKPPGCPAPASPRGSYLVLRRAKGRCTSIGVFARKSDAEAAAAKAGQATVALVDSNWE